MRTGRASVCERRGPIRVHIGSPDRHGDDRRPPRRYVGSGGWRKAGFERILRLVKRSKTTVGALGSADVRLGAPTRAASQVATLSADQEEEHRANGK